MSDPIVWLDDLPAARDSEVGGKGASLVRLTTAGFPVPPGFVLTASAYRAWVCENALAPLIDDLLATSDLRSPKIARDASAALRSAVAGAPLPGECERALLAAYTELRRRSGTAMNVAVRSSALSEDGVQSSSAGLYETVLNVRTAEALLAAVRACFCSLWAARAVQYRAAKGIFSRDESMAVVVMAMVPAQVAGVAFTANPISGSADEIVMNASWGLGEAIVSGRVTPDNYVVRKRDQELVSRDVYAKELAFAPDPSGASGTVVLELPAAQRDAAALHPAQIQQLADLCLAVEREFGSPQDIEWAHSGDQFYLLQSRPITGLR